MGEKTSNNAGCQPDQCPSPCPCPWLLYTREFNYEDFFCHYSPFPPHNKNESCVKSLPQLHGKSILGSSQGWLILLDLRHTEIKKKKKKKKKRKDILSLWNPVTLEILPLPPLYPSEVAEAVVSSFILTCPPDDAHSDKCLLLLFLTSCKFFCWPRRANSSWYAGGQLPVFMYMPIALDGVLYGWADIYDEDVPSFVSLDVVDDDVSNPLKLSSLRLRKPVSRFQCYRTLDYIIQSCGHIYLVYVLCEDWVPKAMEVWELDLMGMNWVEVKSLDGRAFFLCPDCSTWCWGSKNPESGGGVEENCVYFIMSPTLYSYNLQDCSFYANSLTPLDYYLWVMPQHQSLLTRGEWKHRNEKVDVIDQERFSTIEYEELPQHNSTLENLFCELPENMIQVISTYLHLFDYWNFRASCRIFHSATPVAQWRTNNLFPLLMFFKNADGLCQVMDPFRDDSHSFIVRLPRHLQSIHFSKDGWLLVRFIGKSLQFFNPFTRMRGEFPPNEFMDAFKSVGFSTNPTSPDCLTVGICEGDSHVTVHYLQYGDEAWNSCSFPFYRGGECYQFQPSTFSPAYHDGAFYFVDKSWGFLGVFELIAGQPSWCCYDVPDDNNCPRSWRYHLVECEGELLSVKIGYMGKWIKVFRFNQSKKKWVRVKSLGHWILFISPSSSFSVLTKERGIGNKIILSTLKGNSIVFYSLDTCKYHVLGNEEDSLEDFHGTREPIHHCWV